MMPEEGATPTISEPKMTTVDLKKMNATSKLHLLLTGTEVDQLKTVLSSYMSKTSELHQDHVSKENLLMIEQSKTSGVPSIVATHDQWIQGFQKHANIKFQQLELAFSSIKSEISTVVENESRLKLAFETLIKEVASEIGRRPKRNEYRESILRKYSIDKIVKQSDTMEFDFDCKDKNGIFRFLEVIKKENIEIIFFYRLEEDLEEIFLRVLQQ
jgi:hypothetical protein